MGSLQSSDRELIVHNIAPGFVSKDLCVHAVYMLAIQAESQHGPSVSTNLMLNIGHPETHQTPTQPVSSMKPFVQPMTRPPPGAGRSTQPRCVSRSGKRIAAYEMDQSQNPNPFDTLPIEVIILNVPCILAALT